MSLITKASITVLSYCVTIVTIPFFLLFLMLLYIFKKIVNIYLKIKCGKYFGGMVASSDNYWVFGERHRNTTDIVFIANADINKTSNLTEEIKGAIKKSVIDNTDKMPKLFSTLHSCCGYGYLVKKDIDYDLCIVNIDIRKGDENYSKTYLDIFGECTKKQLPYENKLLWQVIIITGPTEWKIRQNLKENQTPVFLRLHHIFADGVAILKAFLGLYSDVDFDVTESIRKVLKNVMKKQNTFLAILQNIHLMLMAPGSLTMMKFKKSDSSINYFQSTTVLGNKIFFVNVDNDKSILKTIKRIKKNLGDTAFLEVVLTAMSASFHRYFSDNSSSVPDVILTAIPIIINLKEAKSKSTELKNTFAFFMLPLPVFVESDYLLDRLTEVKKRTRVLINSDEAKLQNIFFNYISGFIPANLIQYLVNVDNLSMTFSNFPGCPRVHGMNGHDLEHLFFFPPLSGPISIGCTLFTYDERIHFGLTVNDKIMKNKDHCQRIVNDIFQNIKLFDEEVSTRNLS